MLEKLNAIDIGNYNTKMACGRVMIQPGSVALDAVNVVRTPEGAIQDGLILDPQALADGLSDSIEQLRNYSEETIITTASSQIVIRDVMVPKVPRSELRRMMQTQAEEQLPVGLEDHIFDYKVIDEVPPKEKGEMAQYKVMLVAIPINLVNSYLEFLECCGLSCYSIDFTGNSLSKQIAYEMQDKSHKTLTTAIVDIGHKITTATIMTNGKFQFFRSFPHGGEEMTRSISESMSVTLEGAEELKKKYGIMPVEEMGFAGECVIVSQAIKRVLSPLLDAISSYFDFYMSREFGNVIDRIVLVGGGSLVKNIDEFIMKTYSIPVSKHTRVGNSKLERSEEAELGMYFANCLGALK